FRIAGMWLLTVSVALIAEQAPVPMGGVSFATTPADGFGVFLLPLAIAILTIDWARASEVAAPPSGTLRGLMAARCSVLRWVVAAGVTVCAVGLLLPVEKYWYD